MAARIGQLGSVEYHNSVVQTNFDRGICQWDFIPTQDDAVTSSVICGDSLVTTNGHCFKYWNLDTLQHEHTCIGAGITATGGRFFSCITAYGDTVIGDFKNGEIQFYRKRSSDPTLNNDSQAPFLISTPYQSFHGITYNPIQFSPLNLDSDFTLKNGSPVTCLVSDVYKVILGDADGNVKTVDLVTKNISTIFQGNASIKSLALPDETVIAGVENGTIYSYHLTTKKLITVAKAHNCFVNSIVVHEKEVYSCSDDSTIKIWALDTLAPKGTLTNEANGLLSYRCMKILHGRLFVNTYNPTTKKPAMMVWDLKTKQSTTLECVKTDGLSSFTVHEDKLIVSNKKGIQICNFAIPHEQIKYSQLAHLGIVTVEDYLDKLGCYPERFMQTVVESQDDIVDIYDPNAIVTKLALAVSNSLKRRKNE